MITICIAAEKGGVGKTTTAVNLAYGLVLLDKSVCLIDLDAQGHATEWLGFSSRTEEDDAGTNLVEAVAGEAVLRPVLSEFGVFVCRGGEQVTRFESVVSGQTEPQKRLKAAIHASGLAFDFILIDTSPSVAASVVNAIVASDYLLIPATCNRFGQSGVDKTIGLLEDLREIGVTTALLGVLPTQYNRSTTIGAVSFENFQNSDIALEAYTRQNVALTEAFSEQQPIQIYAPKSNGAADYSALAQEIVRLTTRGQK